MKAEAKLVTIPERKYITLSLSDVSISSYGYGCPTVMVAQLTLAEASELAAELHRAMTTVSR